VCPHDLPDGCTEVATASCVAEAFRNTSRCGVARRRGAEAHASRSGSGRATDETAGRAARHEPPAALQARRRALLRGRPGAPSRPSGSLLGDRGNTGSLGSTSRRLPATAPGFRAGTARAQPCHEDHAPPRGNAPDDRSTDAHSTGSAARSWKPGTAASRAASDAGAGARARPSGRLRKGESLDNPLGGRGSLSGGGTGRVSANGHSMPSRGTMLRSRGQRSVPDCVSPARWRGTRQLVNE
jgi:hypothetical protein